MPSKQILSSTVGLIALTLLLLFLGDLKFRQYQSQKIVEAQTQSLQQQADALQKQNDQLNQSLQYLNSPDFKEQVARQQLNYKRQGEVVYGFSGSGTQAIQSQQAAPAESDSQKWWNYFFAD